MTYCKMREIIRSVIIMGFVVYERYSFEINYNTYSHDQKSVVF